MHPTEWDNQTWNCLVLCVDRHSGWMFGCPPQTLGLTAEKFAHLFLNKGWGALGIPNVVTSDQGPQFSGQWFQTMCSCLGIRQAFSQANRPQANGRAEVAEKQLITQLQKLHDEQVVNWVEALPRALHFIHDRPGEGGFSPHQLLFGREKNLAGLPFRTEREC